MPKHFSLTDLAEMRARGYDRTTLESAEQQTQRWHAAQAICCQIETAFAGVALGDGVGLRQGRALDDWADDATAAACRAEDEIGDWQSIPAETLSHFQSSLSFFDAEGMRFHLPAFLIADLQDECEGGLIFALTHLEDYHLRTFALLTPAQRSVVRAYLLFVAEDANNQFYRADIQRALQTYWTDPASEAR